MNRRERRKLAVEQSASQRDHRKGFNGHLNPNYPRPDALVPVVVAPYVTQQECPKSSPPIVPRSVQKSYVQESLPVFKEYVMANGLTNHVPEFLVDDMTKYHIWECPVCHRGGIFSKSMTLGHIMALHMIGERCGAPEEYMIFHKKFVREHGDISDDVPF